MSHARTRAHKSALFRRNVRKLVLPNALRSVGYVYMYIAHVAKVRAWSLAGLKQANKITWLARRSMGALDVQLGQCDDKIARHAAENKPSLTKVLGVHLSIYAPLHRIVPSSSFYAILPRMLSERFVAPRRPSFSRFRTFTGALRSKRQVAGKNYGLG